MAEMLAGHELIRPQVTSQQPLLQCDIICLVGQSEVCRDSRVQAELQVDSGRERSPMSETLDSAGSALSTKFRKPLATSNHYFRKRENAKRGVEGWSAVKREEKNKQKNKRHT
ncbi:hypothetical protein Q5P01_002005 [Channa striata]|uniref:Uncharacterized protein n=1 Tax=Channa striata TaxID=64152 RepID=A0AA88T4F1_CHASR|nr:hypothetical protein Q5P01_002005 [Channa striata]